MILFDHELAWKNQRIYKEIYENSIKYPGDFWSYHETILFPESVNNACYNCVDRHFLSNPEKVAIIWHGDMPGERREVSYAALHKIVQNIASVLLENGIEKGNVVTIYASVSPESIATMLACARIGAIHNVVFAGFAPTVLRERIISSKTKLVLSTKQAKRGGKNIKILENIEKATENLEDVKLIFLEDIPQIGETSCGQVSKDHELFMLYTSGSTGNAKPIKHRTFEYLLYTALTFKYIFDINSNDIYFCTSDIGWITGHSYMVYAPLFHGSTIVIFEGNPTYPTASRYWQIIEEERVSLFYTAPTAIRSLSIFDKSFVDKHDISSLRILGSVGEPINIDAWKWYFEVIGKGKCPIVDTWWQTETGGIALAPLLDINNQKPCYASKPFFGVKAKIEPEGALIINGSCNFGRLMSGDRAVLDDDGDIKILGRIDDVINVSGHRLGAFELENVINSIEGVAESSAVGVPHEIKGQSIFIFVVLSSDLNELDLVKEIVRVVREKVSSIAKPNDIAFVKDLPKTRSGKIKRNILKKLASGFDISEGDLDQIANKSIISELKLSVKNVTSCPDFCCVNS